jgi:hypothetical protein
MSSQGNTEQKEQYWWHHNTQLQVILQSHRNNCIALVRTRKNRHEDQWNRIEGLDMNPHRHTLMPKTCNEEKTTCSTNAAGKTRKLKLNPYHSACTYINSKLIKDLNIRPENLKLV